MFSQAVAELTERLAAQKTTEAELQTGLGNARAAYARATAQIENATARPAPFASRSLLRAHLTRQVSPGSLYRCREGALKSSLWATQEERSLTSAPKPKTQSLQARTEHAELLRAATVLALEERMASAADTQGISATLSSVEAAEKMQSHITNIESGIKEAQAETFLLRTQTVDLVAHPSPSPYFVPGLPHVIL